MHVLDVGCGLSGPREFRCHKPLIVSGSMESGSYARIYRDGREICRWVRAEGDAFHCIRAVRFRSLRPTARSILRLHAAGRLKSEDKAKLCSGRFHRVLRPARFRDLTMSWKAVVASSATRFAVGDEAHQASWADPSNLVTQLAARSRFCV